MSCTDKGWVGCCEVWQWVGGSGLIGVKCGSGWVWIDWCEVWQSVGLGWLMLSVAVGG